MSDFVSGYPDLDLTPLLGNKRYAVHCHTIYEAKHFVNQIKKRYPKKASGWSYGETHFDHRIKMCYAPYLNENDTLSWCEREYYEDKNFMIFEFTDLLPVEEEIEESDMSFDMLL